MKITQNGESYTPTDIIRRGDIVSLTVGCAKVTIDEAAIKALAAAKEQKRGRFYFVARNPSTGKIHCADSSGDEWKINSNTIQLLDRGAHVINLGINGDRASTSMGWLWGIEYHLEQPKAEQQ